MCKDCKGGLEHRKRPAVEGEGGRARRQRGLMQAEQEGLIPCCWHPHDTTNVLHKPGTAWGRPIAGSDFARPAS